MMLSEHPRQNLANADDSLGDYVSDDCGGRRSSVEVQPDTIGECPALTLPLELTSEIFIEYLGQFEHPMMPVATSGPLLLLQVCQFWRAVAVSTPALWTTLKLLMAADEDRVNTLLHRYAPLFRCINLFMEDADLSKLREIGLPVLQRLTLNGHRSSVGVIPTIIRAPNLHEVAFECGFGPQHVGLPWYQLTSLSGEGFGTLECLRILGYTPMLKKWTSQGIYDDPAVEIHSLIISHPTLEHLAIAGGSATLMDFLDLPALRVLSITHTTVTGAPLSQFLARSAKSLRAFTYHARDASPISLAWFHTLRGLTSVSLGYLSPEFIAAFLRSLDRTRDSRFLPYLRSLEVEAPTHVIDTPVMDALWSRFPESASAVNLESIRFICEERHYTISWDEVGDIDWDSPGLSFPNGIVSQVLKNVNICSAFGDNCGCPGIPLAMGDFPDATNAMAADGLTKSLTGAKHEQFVRMLGMEPRPSGSVKIQS
ncbi:hypothetical protein DFH09DRAFT_1070428 [Mycena vulgaris]|nr:hypothetical protein DFH09DRAFT_1070428 [Mycena vulgaris]